MSSVSLVVRSATPADVSTLFDLIQALAAYEKLSDAVVGDEAALREHLFGSRPYIEAVLAEFEGRAVGFALFFTNYSTFLMQPGIYLEDLFVFPEYRGQGIGKALLTHLAQRVLKSNRGRLEWSVLDWNEPAIAFYHRMGAEIESETRICRLTGERLLTVAAEDVPSVRSATPADIPAIFDLSRALAEFDHSLADFVGSSEQLANHLFTSLPIDSSAIHSSAIHSSPVVEAVVAEQSGQVAGMAVFFHNYSTFLTKPGLYIEDLFIAPQYRRQGLGQALLSAVAQQAVVRHCGRVEWLVRTWNQPAIDFYQRIGAVVLPDWRVCRVSGEALMALAQPNSTAIPKT